MSQMRDPVDAAAVRAAIAASDLWTDLRMIAETESTNADVATAARLDAAEGLVEVADYQTVGRGRLGRAWQSPPQAGLTVSLLLRPAGVPVSHWPWLPLLVGVAVAAAIDRQGVAAALKWPNDVLVDDRKVAGILLERVESPAGAAAVVGVGLNVSSRPDELPPGATSLALAGGREPNRTAVLLALLAEMEGVYARWRAAAGTPQPWLRTTYRARCATLGREVRIALPGGRVLAGRAVDIDELGRLVVQPTGAAAAPVAVEAGDVVHVR